MHRRRSYSRYALVAIVLLAGCGSSGPRRQAIRGNVQVDGDAIEQGAITFVPTGDHQGPAALGIIEDGNYAFTSKSGPFPGTHKVHIDVDTLEGAGAATPGGGPKAQLTNAAAGAGGGATASKVHFEVDYTVPESGSKTKDFAF